MDNNLPQILAVDDDPAVLKSIKTVFDGEYHFHFAQNAAEGLTLIDKQDIQLAIIDLGLPDMNGLQLLKKIKGINPSIEIIVLTADNSLHSGVEAMKSGACDYVVKPFDVDQITLVVKNAIEKAKMQQELHYRRLIDAEKNRTLIGESKTMQTVFQMINNVAKNDATVLITGESGTGKELVAQAIHNKSQRKDSPFVPVNCGAIPKELIESELFGHEKGSFTSASYKRLGKFEIAHRGTILLDEISALPIELQSKLLRVLQEKTIERIGGMRPIAVDVRIIAASNVDLKEQIKQGQFREDLYYRLNIVPLEIPPLRERKEDIPLLVDHFLNLYNKQYHRRIRKISPEVMEYFSTYEWKGNVRELENIIQRLLVITPNSSITISKLPPEIRNTKESEEIGNNRPLEEALTIYEKEYIRKALLKTNNNRIEAADLLGIHRNTLLNRIKVLGLDNEE
ncbi:MAG: sigma-54 dependent transcriptional regulator [Planctomycetota bacterium]